MPPVAKKNKTFKAKTIKTEKEIKTEPDSQPQTVISGQLQKQINNKKLKKLPQKKRNRGVVFVKNLPHGFFEEQMRKYFEQFGKVTRLRLARSRRTGNSKGFAFVEFAVPEVAEIAANTMNNYLMFQKIVKTAYIPPEKQKYNYFKSKVRKVVNNVGKEIYISNKTRHIAREMRAYNKWDDEAQKKRIKSNLKKLNKLKKKCEVNIDFNKLILGLDSSQSDNELQNRTDKSDSSTESKKSKKIEKFNRIEEKITAESDSPSKDSDSSKCENLLLVKKRKRNMNDTNSSQDSKTINDNKKSKKSLNTSDSKSEDKEEKQSIKSSLSKSVSSTSLASSSSSNDLQNTSVNKTSNSDEDDTESDDHSEEDDIDMIKMKQNKTKQQKKEKETGLDAIIKKKPLLGGIQKAKNIKNNNHKLLKIKEQKNNQNEKLKKNLIEASLKEMMKMTNIKNKTEKKSFQKVRKTKKN